MNSFSQQRPDLADIFKQANDHVTEVFKNTPLDSLKIREKIALGVRAHIQFCAPYKDALQDQRQQHPLSSKLNFAPFFKAADHIWWSIGDKSTDFNYYSKRTLLMHVHHSTFHFWLSDNSEGNEATWEHLDQAINRILKIPVIKSKLKQRLQFFLPALFSEKR